MIIVADVSYLAGENRLNSVKNSDGIHYAISVPLSGSGSLLR